MIEELKLIELKEYTHIADKDGRKPMRYPNNREIMDKMNEIIRHINATTEK